MIAMRNLVILVSALSISFGKRSIGTVSTAWRPGKMLDGRRIVRRHAFNNWNGGPTRIAANPGILLSLLTGCGGIGVLAFIRSLKR